jgi:DNA-binding NtrC family response regulator
MPPTILVVDDEEAIRGIVSSMLGSVGYESLQADDGLSGWAILESGQHVDVILSGLMMPGLDGIAFMERVFEKHPGIPFVLVTGVHDPSVKVAALRNGAFDYILKPFERERLLDAVCRALASRNTKRDT